MDLSFLSAYHHRRDGEELQIRALLVRPMTFYAKRKAGFHNMRPRRAHALSRRGTRAVVELANDYAHTYAPFIQAAVREVGHNYRQVANWLTREHIPAQRAGQWKAQSVKNLVVRYWRLTGRRILIPYKRFPTRRLA